MLFVICNGLRSGNYPEAEHHTSIGSPLKGRVYIHPECNYELGIVHIFLNILPIP
jgi:hypothetical protein